MANASEPQTDLRGLVGRNIQQALDSVGYIQHSELATALRRRGLSTWDKTTVSRLVGGKRGLGLDEAVVLCSVLQVPMTQLLAGDDTVTLAGNPVPAAQLRDIVQNGRVGVLHRGSTVLDDVTATTQWLTDTVADKLGLDPAEVNRLAQLIYQRAVEDEYLDRMAASFRAWQREQPGAQPDEQTQAFRRRTAAWSGHHLRAITDQIRQQHEGNTP